MDAESQANESRETLGAGAPSASARPRASRRSLALPVSVFACMALLVVAAGLLVYRDQAAQVRAEQGRELAAIRDLKAAEISRWMAAQMTSATAAGDDPVLSGAVRLWTSSGAAPPAPFVVRSLIDTTRVGQGYLGVLLLDQTLRVIYAAPGGGPPPGAVTRALGKKAMDRRQVEFSDIYVDAEGRPSMEFLAPLTGGAPASSSPPGVLALEVDPDAFLFPLLNSWPAISRTGETLLVERRGDQVVFLTTTRERRADALHLAFPVTRTEIPAVKAARGAIGVVTGIDYSGTEVLAAIGPVRGTPWFLISKVDVAEVDAPLRSLALLTIVIVLAVTVLGGAVILFFWNSWRARDFQQLYETERELRASEERFTVAFEHAPVGISFTLPDGRVGHANATLAEMLGRSVAELQGLTVAEITHPDDRAETARLMQATLAGEMDGFKVDKRYLRKDGSGIWTTASVTLLRDGQSRPVNFVAMISDISAGKAAEDALRASEARFRGLFETALIGFALHEIVLDEAGLPADYVYVAANQAFTDLTGLDAAGVVGRRASEVFAGLPEPPYLAIYGETALGGPPHRFETYFEPLHRHFDIQVFSPQAGQFATVFLDVTERKEAEDARREAERELAGMNVELERRVLERTLELEAANAELEAFSYSVSHDLRAPLRALDGFSLALIDDYGEQLDDTATDYLTRVRAASQRMGQLIDDLLKLSRVSRREMVREQVDLTSLAREVLADLREAEPKRVVHAHVEDGLVAGGDPALLRVVLQNLLANAWKFTSRKPQARIEVGAERRDGVAAYYVRDDGAGFDPTYADKLFTPFQRLHTAEEFPGTGVGLATVKRIVRRHGGSVWAEGVVDSGATFYFTLD